MKPDRLAELIKYILLTPEEIAGIVSRLACQINQQFSNCENLAIVPVLRGAWIFSADLVRQITVPHFSDFLEVNSYGEKRESSGSLELVKLPKPQIIAGNIILVVDDIVETGETLKYIKEQLITMGAVAVHFCCLLSKPGKRKSDTVDVAFIGQEIGDDEFVFGYGLDLAYRERNYPGIAVAK